MTGSSRKLHPIPSVLSVLAVLALLVSACGKGKPGAQGYAGVSGFTVERRVLLGEGIAFGGAGQYEALFGRVSYVLDPVDSHNTRVTDLVYAAGPDGRVRYEAEAVLVKPVDLARANGALLYTVVNRGNFDTRLSDPAPWAALASGPTGSAEPLARLMKQGFCLAFSGWQADLIDTPERLKLYAPEARQEGAVMPGQALAEIEGGPGVYQSSLADPNHEAFPVLADSAGAAEMRVHESHADPGTVIPRGDWRFARIVNTDTLADSTSVVYSPGFQPGKLYTVRYRPSRSPLMGLGFTAVRDLVGFLRSADTLNPLRATSGASAVTHTLAYGSSQCGRFLRDFVYQGFNAALNDSVVFDGVLSNVPGCRRGFFNYRFAQPSRAWGFYPQFEFPFADLTSQDALSGVSGCLQCEVPQRYCPKTFYVHHSAEYWSSGAALTHVDTRGASDLPIPDNVRIYLIRGTSHGNAPLVEGHPAESAGSYLPPNPNNPDLVEAPLLEDLARWVTDGELPPESSYPRLDKGELVALEEFGFPAVKGIAAPALVELHPRFDWGPRFAQGILDNALPVPGELYPVLVPAVGPDGNEIAGIATPMAAVPLASYTGWNYPAWFDRVENTRAVRLSGAWLPFAATREERQRLGDSRKSVGERYRGRGVYQEAVRKAAEDLVARRLMFEEDIPSAVEQAGQMWDWVSAHGAWTPPAGKGRR